MAREAGPRSSRTEPSGRTSRLPTEERNQSAVTQRTRLISIMAVVSSVVVVVVLALGIGLLASGHLSAAALAVISPAIALVGVVIGFYFGAQTSPAYRGYAADERDASRADEFMRAVELLAGEKTELRLAGIYSLERIAQDSPRDRARIQEVLAAYVRQHASRPRDYTEIRESVTDPTRTRPPVADVVAAITVLARGQTFDATDRAIDLSGVQLPYLELPRAFLPRVILAEANLAYANLAAANLKGANLESAVLIGATLLSADLEGALVARADLRGAVLAGANLEGANFFQAQLTDANLSGVHDANADWSEADLTGTLRGNSDAV